MDVHVLHVVRTLIVEGGMERAMRRVVEGLGRRGIRHSILLLSDAVDVLDFGRDAPVHRVVSPPRDLRMPLGIRGALQRLRPTVIHVRNWGPWPDTMLARMLSWPPTPLIWSFHGVESLDALPVPRRLAFRAAGRLTTRVFAVSGAARRLLVSLVGIPEERIEVIANGVDTERFRPLAAPLPGRERFVVGTVGRLEPIKNHHLLVDAVGELVRRGLDVELRIAGEGSLEGALRRAAAERGLAERVQFLGHVEDTPGFLTGLDAFALTSDSEGNPNALLEAMSCGLPTVATAVGGIEEVLEGGRAGLLVPPATRAPLVNALVRLVESKRLRATLGERARARVIGTYGLDRMLDAYEALYRAPERRRG